MINFDNTYAQLPSVFFRKISQESRFQPTLLKWNDSLAQSLGVDLSTLSDQEKAEFFSATKFFPGSTPIAMAYAAHQFGHFVPQLGDGRAMLLGEFLSPDKTRFDVHLKGSGQTDFSRRGDGRSAIGPVVREYLVSEGMFALGVPTTRSLCATRTGELVRREQDLPGGVLTRIAKSHIRIGTFQFFAARGDFEHLKILADYSIERLYPEAQSYFDFWQKVSHKQIALIAQWMSLGFIHGVMNTDNMAISGETIDYGPCAFMDEFNFHKVFSSIDQQGRYAYSNQPGICFWNLARLAETLIPIMGPDHEDSKKKFEAELNGFEALYLEHYRSRMGKKLGLSSATPVDDELIHIWLTFLENNGLDFTLSFIDLERLIEGKTGFTSIADEKDFKEIFSTITQRQLLQPGGKPAALQLMKEANPLTIPRNHQIERAIKACEQGDDRVFHEVLAEVQKPFERSEKLLDYQVAPKVSERVLKTFCGT